MERKPIPEIAIAGARIDWERHTLRVVMYLAFFYSVAWMAAHASGYAAVSASVLLAGLAASSRAD